MKLMKFAMEGGVFKLSSVCALALLDAAVLLPLGALGDTFTLGNEARLNLPFVPSPLRSVNGDLTLMKGTSVITWNFEDAAAPLAALTVTDMRGFTGSLVGYGAVTVERGAALDRNRVTIADTLTVNVLGTGMTVIIR